MNWKRALGALLLLIVGAVASFVVVMERRAPESRPLTDRTFEKTDARLARGTYLVENVYACFVCHGERDWKLPGAPPRADRKGAGLVWTAEGMPWLTAPNLTPDPVTGIGSLSDDTLARAIREGISHDGRALFPLMPYMFYRRLPDEDLASIIVYLRSIPPVVNALPATAVPFPLRLFIKSAPKPVIGIVGTPDLSTPEKRGEFLVRTIECAGCHTPKKQGQPLPDYDLAGGFELLSPLGRVVSTNITPDASGIPHYDEALFVEMMRTGKVKGREISAVMPWAVWKGMTDDDLKAMFAYLRTLPKVAHRVNNTDPPTACPRCGEKHGLGDQN